jgi:oligopeptide/dipeptide ABC transporter ATP-binding protein
MTAALDISDLSVAIADREVVRGVTLRVEPGERVGVVGESGSGKSLTALSVMRLLPQQARVTGGSIRHAGRDLLTESDASVGSLRGRSLGMVFQNAAAALNPVLKIGRQVADVLLAHSPERANARGKRAAFEEARSLLGSTGLVDPASVMNAYPHQLSGGMAQRVLVAMALSSRPQLLIADEPTTGLDMSIQAQVLALLAERLDRTGAALLLISHDIAVVGEICERIVVMYGGRVVESGSTGQILSDPRHPYTRALLECTNDESIALRALMPTIPGEPPDLASLARGCSFAPRCPLATERCRVEAPLTRAVADRHAAECHYA